MLEKSLKNNENLSRLQSYARILSEFDERLKCIKLLEKIINLLKQEVNFNLPEPFLCVSPTFEKIDPKNNLYKWCYASVIEQKEKLFHSSYFNNGSGLNDIHKFISLGFNTPEMERRRLLNEMHFFEKSSMDIDPILSKKNSGNLNPKLWSINKIGNQQ